MAHRGPFRCECGELHEVFEESNDLAQHIHTEGITCLNESVAGACQRVFRPPGQRPAGEDVALHSVDDDAELVRTHRPLLDARGVGLVRGERNLAPLTSCHPISSIKSCRSSSMCPST